MRKNIKLSAIDLEAGQKVLSCFVFDKKNSVRVSSNFEHEKMEDDVSQLYVIRVNRCELEIRDTNKR